jgi:hypothetical protein
MWHSMQGGGALSFSPDPSKGLGSINATAPSWAGTSMR